MWGRTRKPAEVTAPEAAQPGSLKDAVRKTRIEMAETSSVVVDLRDAELVRLELLNEALDPVFGELPPALDLFDRGISRGDTPRLWIDAVAHVAMGRDKRLYRFVNDTRYGRRVLAEGTDIARMVEAITHYVATRIIERERALAGDESLPAVRQRATAPAVRESGGWRVIRAFLFGLALGGGALFAALWVAASRMPH